MATIATSVTAVEPGLYTWTGLTVYYLSVIYAFIFILPMIILGLPEVSKFQPGPFFVWQFAAVIIMVGSSRVEILAPQRPELKEFTAYPYVVRRSKLMAGITTTVRCLLALLLFVTNTTFLVLRLVHVFSINCDTDPNDQYCQEATLIAVALVGVLLMTVVSSAMLYILARMPIIPSMWTRDPIDIDLTGNIYDVQPATPALFIEPSGRAAGRNE